MMASPFPSSEPKRRYKQYPAYRDSGVEWLGEVPAHWVIRRLKATIHSAQNGLWGDEPSGAGDMICVRVADFDRTKFRVKLTEPTLRSYRAADMRGRVVTCGDLLLEKSGGGENQPVGAVVLYDQPQPVMCSNFIARLQIAPAHDSRFLTYLHAAAHSAGVNTRSIKQNTGIQNLDSESYFSELAALPVLDEQRAIAAFLDRETVRIDALIAKKERLIKLLQEKREAMIAHSVTRGLNPTDSNKDSSVPWLGKVPRHWAVERVKSVAQMESGHTPAKTVSAYWVGGTIPWVSLRDTAFLKEHDYISNTAYQTTSAGIENSSARLLPPRTVVFSRDATIGRCAITTRQMAVSQHFIAWIAGERVIPEYLLYIFRSMTQELERLTMGATLRTIGMPDVKSLVMPVPPLREQQEIVHYVVREQARYDALMTQVREAAARLTELRLALISAAVTGKIDVREEVA